MFLEPEDISDIYLYIEYVDFRKGMYSLGSYVTFEFSDESGGKNLFIFSNRSRDKARILYWNDTGFALWHTALEKDKFRWPVRGDATITLSLDQLKSLLRGLSIEAHETSSPKLFY